MPILNHSHIDFNFLQIDHSKELYFLYILRFINDIISRLAGFFIPLFLFSFRDQIPVLALLPFSDFQKGIFIVLTYYFVLRLSTLLTSILSGKIIAKLGTRFSILISFLFQSTWLLSLNSSQSHPYFLILAAISSGIHINFFFTPFYTMLSRYTQKRHTSQDLSVIELILQLISVVTPALGGLIIVILGYDTLFLLSLIGVIFGLVIACLMETHHFDHAPTLSEFIAWMKEKSYQKLVISYTGRYINDGALVLWPLYVFILVGSIVKVGYLYSLSLFLAMVIVVVTGFYVDHQKSRKPFFLSGGILSLIWLIKTQIISIWGIAIVDTINKLTSSFHWLYYDSLFMRRAKGSKDLHFFVYREFVTSLIAIIFWASLLPLFLLPFNWSGVFVFAAFGVILSLMVNDKYEQKEE